MLGNRFCSDMFDKELKGALFKSVKNNREEVMRDDYSATKNSFAQ